MGESSWQGCLMFTGQKPRLNNILISNLSIPEHFSSPHNFHHITKSLFTAVPLLSTAWWPNNENYTESQKTVTIEQNIRTRLRVAWNGQSTRNWKQPMISIKDLNETMITLIKESGSSWSISNRVIFGEGKVFRSKERHCLSPRRPGILNVYVCNNIHQNACGKNWQKCRT